MHTSRDKQTIRYLVLSICNVVMFLARSFVSLANDGVGIVSFPLCDDSVRAAVAAARPRRAPSGSRQSRDGHAASPEQAEVRGRVIALVASSAMDVTSSTDSSAEAAPRRTTSAPFLE